MDDLTLRRMVGFFPLAVVALLGLAGGPATAGFITIKVRTDNVGDTPVGFAPEGSTYPNDFKYIKDGSADDKDPEVGVVKVQVGTDEEEKKIKSVMVVTHGKDQSPHFEVYKLDASHSLFDIEPLDVPDFDAPIPLFAVIDLVGLSNRPNAFTPGELLSVTNGIVAGAPELLLKDGSSLPGFSTNTHVVIDDALIASLPNYSGGATVRSLIQLSPVPEPAGLVPFGCGLLVLAAYVGRRGANESGATRSCVRSS